FQLMAGETNENIAANPLQLLLGAASVIVVLLAGADPGHPRRRYALCLLAASLLFLIVLRWQPWITRLQLPLFAPAAPPPAFLPLAFLPPALLPLRGGRAAWIRTGKRLLQAILAAGLIFFAWRPLWENAHRPLFPSSGPADSIWHRSGNEILFIARP